MMKGQKVGVIGAGRSGLAAARFLKRLGANVLLSDSGNLHGAMPSGIDIETGRHSKRLLDCDLIIRSPGVPGHLPILDLIRRQRIPIWSELELASRYAQARDLIAVTGTNGKTTTTTLIGEFLKRARRKTFVAGNIGLPLSAVAAKTSPSASVILEVSSYQLENIETFHPTVSAILNITPDHLEHHGTMKAYADAKARVFENQAAGDVCVLNADDAWCRKLAKKCRAKIFWFSRKRKLKSGIYWKPSPYPLPKGRGQGLAFSLQGEGGRRPDEGIIHLRWGSQNRSWPLKTNLPGPHNIENILAAVAVGVAASIPVPTMRQVLTAFRGVEHRLELVRTLRGVRYINDSKGTNVDSTRVALLSFSDPLVLILGGQGKGSPYVSLKPLIQKRAKIVLLIGEDTPRIARELRSAAPMERMNHLARAVRRAQQIAEAGDVVLLSPACASFDQYNNYEERGRHFKALVRGLR